MPANISDRHVGLEKRYFSFQRSVTSGRMAGAAGDEQANTCDAFSHQPSRQTNRVEPSLALRCTVERRMGCRGFLRPHSSRAPTARPGSGTQPQQSGIFLLPANCISRRGSIVFLAQRPAYFPFSDLISVPGCAHFLSRDKAGILGSAPRGHYISHSAQFPLTE